MNEKIEEFIEEQLEIMAKDGKMTEKDFEVLAFTLKWLEENYE